jgi:hypothetical protein
MTSIGSAKGGPASRQARYWEPTIQGIEELRCSARPPDVLALKFRDHETSASVVVVDPAFIKDLPFGFPNDKRVEFAI